MLITPKKRTIQPGDVFEGTVYTGGLKWSNSKAGCKVAALQFFVK
jgi:hypothetical protein